MLINLMPYIILLFEMLIKQTIDYLKNIYQSGSDTIDKSPASSPWFLSFWIAESTAFLYESAATPLGKIFPLQTHWFKNLNSLQIDREKKRRNTKTKEKMDKRRFKFHL